MKRRFLLFFIGTMLFGSCLKASAADGDRVLWGIKASVDAELPGKWRGKDASVKMFNNGLGFTAGAVSNIYLGKNFFFEPGLLLFYSQYRYDFAIGDMNFMEKNPKLTKFGVEVPVVFGYNFDITDRFALSVFTGPQIRYAFGADVKIEDKDLRDEYEDLLKWDTFRRLDCAWKIGVGFPLYHFMFSLEADIGMNNLIKSSKIAGPSKMTFRENRFGLGVTYYF